MAFYDSLAHIYDGVFPNKQQFAEKMRSLLIPDTARVLDIGCGTGSFLIPLVLANDGICGFGIELNEKMLNVAKELTPSSQEARLQWVLGDMSKLDQCNEIRGQKFDNIFCIGNTIPHLDTWNDFSKFLNHCKGLLSKESNGGVLVLQLLNYKKIQTEKVWELPKISVDEVLFERVYRFDDIDGASAEFASKLTWKDGKIESFRVRHLLMLPVVVGETVRNAGFSYVQMYAGTGLEPFDEARSSHLLLIAKL